MYVPLKSDAKVSLPSNPELAYFSPFYLETAINKKLVTTVSRQREEIYGWEQKFLFMVWFFFFFSLCFFCKPIARENVCSELGNIP